jgi:RNA polymerase sigma-70 factor (ECF subfamily)
MSEMAAADAELALRIHRGDKQAEAALFARFSPGIQAIMRRATGSYALAEELTQETLIVTLRRLRATQLAEPAKLAAFVAQTARNLAIAEKRKARRQRTDSGTDEIDTVPDAAPGHDNWVEADSAARAVRALLQELRSERDRHILVHHYLEGRDKAEICQEWGITDTMFHVALFRARKRFLELLDRRGIRRTDLFSVILL